MRFSVALFELSRSIWQDFFCYFVIFFPCATFLVTSYIPLSWNKEMHLLRCNILSSQLNNLTALHTYLSTEVNEYSSKLKHWSTNFFRSRVMRPIKVWKKMRRTKMILQNYPHFSGTFLTGYLIIMKLKVQELDGKFVFWWTDY